MQEIRSLLTPGGRVLVREVTPRKLQMSFHRLYHEMLTPKSRPTYRLPHGIVIHALSQLESS